MREEDGSKTVAFQSRIFKEILYGNYAPGDRLPGERETAEACGISRITVRRAYEKLEKSGILERRQGSGTYVAQHHGANRNSGNLIALLSSVGELFSLDFIRAMEKEVSAHGDLLVLRLTDDSPELEEAAAIELVGNGVNNLVIWPSGRGFRAETFARLRVLGTNMVFFDRMIPGDYADYVGLDNRDALKQLFLRAGNVRSPLFISHAEAAHDSDRARESAFEHECQLRNIAGTVLRVSPEEPLRLPPEILEKADVIFAVNDAMALRVLPFVGEKTVFGIDGLSREIVSYRQPMRLLAQKVIKLLYKQRDGAGEWHPAKVFIKGEICEKLS